MHERALAIPQHLVEPLVGRVTAERGTRRLLEQAAREAGDAAQSLW